MCGILVCHSPSGIDLQTTVVALDLMKNRGPDGQIFSHEEGGRLFLGQRILSISGDFRRNISAYHQSENGRFVMTYNGEIYNDFDLKRIFLPPGPLKTDSDSECLVNLFQYLEPEVVFAHLQGMFAFAVFDRFKKKLYLGRDLAGEKPLYYYKNGAQLIVCSEINPILSLESNVKINTLSLKRYFYTRHWITLGSTAFSGIHEIPPGSLVSFDLKHYEFKTIKSLSLSNLINPDTYHQFKSLSHSDYLERIDGQFADNAKNIVHKGDYASVFSGGIDSSLAAWYLKKFRSPKALLYLNFEGKDPIAPKIRTFEKILQMPITVLDVNEELYSQYLLSAVKNSAGLMNVHTFISQLILAELAAKQGCKVLVGGDGADELWGGYEFYRQLDIPSQKRIQERNPSLYSGYLHSSIPILNDLEQREWLNQLEYAWHESLQAYNWVESSDQKKLMAMLLTDSIVEMPEVGLKCTDSMSMVYQVESRSFFVLSPLISLALSSPIQKRIDLTQVNPHFRTKTALKSIFASKFGEDKVFPKQGFSGFPNEAARKLIKGDYYLTSLLLGRKIPSKIEDRELEWKFLNVELFLRNYQHYL